MSRELGAQSTVLGGGKLSLLGSGKQGAGNRKQSAGSRGIEHVGAGSK